MKRDRVAGSESGPPRFALVWALFVAAMLALTVVYAPCTLGPLPDGPAATSSDD